MPYPDLMVAHMREQLVQAGFTELLTPDQVDAVLDGETRTLLLAVNSTCGCAAGMMRPGVYLSLQNARKKPEILTTVFAGQDLEATERAREYITGYPPSSPSLALFKGGEIVYFMPREEIKGRFAEDIAEDLKAAYEEHC